MLKWQLENIYPIESFSAQYLSPNVSLGHHFYSIPIIHFPCAFFYRCHQQRSQIYCRLFTAANTLLLESEGFSFYVFVSNTFHKPPIHEKAFTETLRNNAKDPILFSFENVYQATFH